MKRLLLFIIHIFTFYSVSGETFTVNNIKYNTTGTNTVEVASSDSYEGSITIPSTVIYNGIEYSVTGIGDQAFYYCDITSITMPETVSYIGNKAFYRCNLSSINISASVLSIGQLSFYNCSRLMSIFVNENNPNYSSLSGVLFNKDMTTMIACPAGLTGDFSIPNTITNIESSVFHFSNLSSISIPNSVRNIAAGAFYYCTNLTNVNIPSSVISIGYSIFSGCSHLESIIVDANNSKYCSLNNALYNKSQTKIMSFPGGFSGSFDIPISVDSIDIGAFYGCANLTGITIPNSVSYIGDGAFEYCSSLTNITIPNSVSSIKNYTFDRCTNLTTITIPETINSIGNNAFYECNSLASITIPKSATSIGDYAFYKCNNLSEMIIPNSITKIGENSFQGCNNLEIISIPSSVNFIGSSAFAQCVNLHSIYSYSSYPVDLSNNSYIFKDVDKTVCTLYVPLGSKNRYQAANQWNEFSNIEEFGITNLDSHQAIKTTIYRNKTTNNLQIEGLSGPVFITIFDMNGKSILHQKISENSSIPLSLSKGVYVLKLQIENGSRSKKIYIY